MSKFSIILLVIFLFPVMSYAQAQNDPCAQYSNPQEKNVCKNMVPSLNAYRDNLMQEHAMPFISVPEAPKSVPRSDLEDNDDNTIKLPSIPGQDSGVSIQKRRNIFQ